MSGLSAILKNHSTEELKRPIEDLDEEARDVLFGSKRRT